MARLDTLEGWWTEVNIRLQSEQLERLFYEDVKIPNDVLCQEFMDREARLSQSTHLKKAFAGREGLTFENAVKDMITKRDPNLWHVFQSIWEDVPDSRRIHSYTMWGPFCDLCSEGPAVLFPNMEEDDG